MAQPIPDKYHSITANFTFKDSNKAIEFYKRALNAELMDFIPNVTGSGVMHATMQIGNSMIMMGDENAEQGCKSAESLGHSPISFYLYVSNVDQAFRQAVEAGGKELMPVSDMFWGDRAGGFIDPFGYTWTLATHTKDLTKEEISKGAEEFCAEMQKNKH